MHGSKQQNELVGKVRSNLPRSRERRIPHKYNQVRITRRIPIVEPLQGHASEQRSQNGIRNITVEVVKIQGNRISLGIVAPSDVKILRGELNQTKAIAQLIELIVEDGLLVAC